MSKLAKAFDAYSFQELCVDVLFDIYAEKFEVYGREGQTQNGIDLQSQTKVAQCKFYSEDTKNPYGRLITQVKKDYSTACQHFVFTEFIVITSLNRDTSTQDTIRWLTDTEHTVSIMFWEDIEKVALNNKEILKLHFSSYLNSQDMSLLEQNQLIFKQKFLELFGRYDIYKLVTEPRLEGNFDSSVFESFDALAEEYNYLIELYSPETGYISSRLRSQIVLFFKQLDYYYSYIAKRTRPLNQYTAMPLTISHEDFNEYLSYRETLQQSYQTTLYYLK